MSKKINYAGTKALKKTINGDTIYLMKSWDLVHGKGWFVRILTKNFKIGDGFHSKSMFAAYKEALASLSDKKAQPKRDHEKSVWSMIAYSIYAFTLRNLRCLSSLLKRHKVQVTA